MQPAGSNGCAATRHDPDKSDIPVLAGGKSWPKKERVESPNDH